MRPIKWRVISGILAALHWRESSDMKTHKGGREMANQSLFDSLSNNTRKPTKEGKGKMGTNTRKFGLALVIGLALFAGLTAVVLAGTFAVTVTDQTPAAPLANPVPTSYQPRYISGFGSDDSFTVFFEDRDNGNAISYAQTTSGPTGFPVSATATNIATTHFLVKDWPINIGGTDYAYRAWGTSNSPTHSFYVSNDLANWTLVSTFTIPNVSPWTSLRPLMPGYVYYGFHDVILLNGTYYAFAESNRGQTLLVRSANGDDVWEAFDSVGGTGATWGPLQLPESGTPSGSFVDLGHDRGYGKVHVRGNDSGFYLAVNTAAVASLAPAALEAAFINPVNWTWHDGTTGLPTTPILSATGEHDLRECWVVPNTDPDADWVIIYDADFGSADGGKALGYATLSPPLPPPEIVWVDDDYTEGSCGGHTWGYDAFDNIQDGIDAVAGSTVNVAAGTYTPASTIVIDKDNLVLQGPQADVDPRPSQGSTRTAGSEEAVIDGGLSALGKIIYIDADNVVINGLEVKSGTEDMIRQSNPHSGTVVKYCIIHDGLGDEGVQLKKATNAVLEYNYVFEIADKGDGLNIAADSSYGVIRYNEVAGIHGENAAIYIYGAEHMEISGNLVRDSGLGGNDGIKVGDKGGDDAAKRDVLVKDNIIHGITQDGISVYMSGVTVEGNEIYDCHSENGAIYLAHAISDITIRGNSVHDNALKPSVKPHVGGIGIESPVDVANVHINFNNIYNNTPYGVNNHASGIVDATNNWWGSVDGPEDTDSGTNEVTPANCGSYTVAQMLNAGAEISGSLGDKVSDNVDYCPWLTAPYQPTTSMTSFVVDDAKFDCKKEDNDGKIHVKGKLELATNKDISDDIIVTVGSWSCTINMEEKGKEDEHWEYNRPKGNTGGIKHMKIDWNKGTFDFEMDGLDLSEVDRPVTISVQIGDDLGEATVPTSRITEVTIDSGEKDDGAKVCVKGELGFGPVCGAYGSPSSDIIVSIKQGDTNLSWTISQGDIEVKGKEDESWEYKPDKHTDTVFKHAKVDWNKGTFDFDLDGVDLGSLDLGNEVDVSVTIEGNTISETVLLTEKGKKDQWKPEAIADQLQVVAYPNPIRDVHTATFQARGTLAAEVEEIRVQIYDLSGHLVWEDAALGSELDWHTDSLSGDYLANGIYLYRVQIRIGGSWINQDIGKIAVLR